LICGGEVDVMRKKKAQTSNSGVSHRSLAEKRNEHFAKFLHPLWDLSLVQDHLKTKDDLLVLLAMLRYADFNTGECAVFIPKIMRDTGVKHATQVKRCIDKIERMGAFCRPKGKKRLKKVYGKPVGRYIRATGKQIIAHAVANNLIGEKKLLEIELRQVEKEIESEAEAVLGGGNGSGSSASRGGDARLDDVPETMDELIEQMRRRGESDLRPNTETDETV
jgi:hypothetical protein